MGNTREVNGNAAILARINKGWKPNRYLTNMSMAYFADPKDHVATLQEIMLRESRLSVKYHRQRWDTLITATNAL